MTISEDVKDVTLQVTHALPPQLLALLLINMVFVLGLLWFLHDLSLTRIEAVRDMFKTCVQHSEQIKP